MVHSCYRLEDQDWVAMTYWLVFRGHEQIFNFQSLIWLFFRRYPNEWWASKWCRADGTVERDNGFHFCQCDQDAWANNLQNDSLSSVVLRSFCPLCCRVGCGIAAHIRAGGKQNKAVSHRKGRGQDGVLRNMSWVSCFHVLSPPNSLLRFWSRNELNRPLGQHAHLCVSGPPSGTRPKGYFPPFGISQVGVKIHS